MLSALIKNDLYNDDELIIDEIVILFLAGSKTVQLTTTNLFCYLEKEPEVRRKLQAEIDEKLGPIKDDINGKFDQELSDSFEYLKNCFLESLRIEPPVTMSG